MSVKLTNFSKIIGLVVAENGLKVNKSYVEFPNGVEHGLSQKSRRSCRRIFKKRPKANKDVDLRLDRGRLDLGSVLARYRSIGRKAERDHLKTCS